MPFEEKRSWIMMVVTIAAYAVYATIVLGRADGTPLTEVPYAAAMLWSIGGAIVGAILLNILVDMVSHRGTSPKDQRDREIHRFGEYIGQSFVIIGGVAALLMAIAEVDYFWIANVIYLAFVLSSLLGSTAKLIGYHRGFQPW